MIVNRDTQLLDQHADGQTRAARRLPAAPGGDRESRLVHDDHVRGERRVRRDSFAAIAEADGAVAPGVAGRCSPSRERMRRAGDARERSAFIHESAYVDDGATIGAGTKIWHFCHVMPGAVIGERCSLGQNVVVMNGTRMGDELQDSEQRVDLRGRRARGRRVLRPVDGVHERDQSAQPCVAQERVPADAGQARRVDRRQRDDRVRRDARRIRVRRRRRGRHEGRAALRADGRRAGAAHRLDVPVRRAAARRRRRPCAACGTVYERRGDGIVADRTQGSTAKTHERSERFGSRSSAAGASARTTSTPFARSTDCARRGRATSTPSARAAPGRSRASRAFESLDEMLARRATCDIVDVCTPSGLHAAHGAAAAHAGKHVVTRKADGDLAHAKRTIWCTRAMKLASSCSS